MIQIERGITSSSSSDYSDCSVRCLANITGWSYDQAKSIMAPARKSSTDGADTPKMVEIYRSVGLKCVAIYGTTMSANWFRSIIPADRHSKGTTVGTLVKKMGNKTYAILVKGHVFAVVKGVIQDTHAFDRLKNRPVVAHFEMSESV